MPAPGQESRGFSLIEVLVAMVIAVIAVLGLAHAFGAGRALINRYEMARDAQGVAQREMEVLAAVPLTSDSLDAGVAGQLHGPFPVTLGATQTGTAHWVVSWMNDPADDVPGPDANPNDYKLLRMVVDWTQSGLTDSVTISRIVLSP